MNERKETTDMKPINPMTIPDELVDENLRTDINWLRRLTLSLENSKEMLDTL